VGLDYALIDRNRVYAFGYDKFDNPDFLYGSVQFKYTGINKYRIEPYLRISRGITPYNQFWLPFFAPDGIRHLYIRDVEIGATYRVFGKMKRGKTKKGKKK
jgi:hypothetical protein